MTKSDIGKGLYILAVLSYLAGVIWWSVDFFVPVEKSSAAGDWTVSGAGNNAYNGVYTEAGIWNGDPYYTYGSYALYRATNGVGQEMWRLWTNALKQVDGTPATNAAYFGQISAVLPANAWTTGSGVAPAPTLAAVPVEVVPDAPTIGAPSAQSTSVIRWNFTDNADNETGFKVYDGSNTLKATCASANLTYCDETGLAANTEYSGRYVVAYNGVGNSAHSGTAVTISTLSDSSPPPDDPGTPDSPGTPDVPGTPDSPDSGGLPGDNTGDNTGENTNTSGSSSAQSTNSNSSNATQNQDTKPSGTISKLGDLIASQESYSDVAAFTTKINNALLATTTGLILAPFLVNLAMGLSNLLPQSLYWLMQLLQMIGIRKKRKPWGVVFNSQTGQPVALAIVRIFDQEYRKLLESAVTDREGRFGFLVRPGTFYLVVSKSSYNFPSVFKKSEFFENVYNGEELKIGAQNEGVVIVNTPIDPQTKASALFTFWVYLVKINRLLQKIRIPLMAVGVIFALVMMISNYYLIYLLSLMLYGFFIIIELLKLKKMRPYGIVSDDRGNPLSIVMVRIFNQRTNRLVATDVTDAKGRFRFLVNPGSYYLMTIKPGFVDYKSHPTLLKGEKTLVATDIKMKKI